MCDSLVYETASFESGSFEKYKSSPQFHFCRRESTRESFWLRRSTGEKMSEDDIDRKVTKCQLEEHFEEAASLQREKLERVTAKCGKDSIDVAAASFRLGSILEATTSSYEEIEALYRKALNIYRKHRRSTKKIELEFATAEILSSLAKIVSKDSERQSEADAIHRSSLNVYSNWFEAKEASEEDDSEIIRSLVALDIDTEDVRKDKKQTKNNEDNNISWDEYNRQGSQMTKKFTRTL